MSQKLSREYIKRLGRRGSEESKGSGGGLSQGAIEAALAGYAKEGWVNENYLSIEFFSRLFQAHGKDANDQDVDVDPNDLDTTITSVESMFGFWTDYYISALGNGGDLGSAIYLSTLGDVQLTSPSDGQALVYDSASNKWVNQTISTTTALANLTDVLLTSPQANQVLLYDGVNNKWINSALKTINGQPIYGSGDLSVGGGASGNYLPLTGGTLQNNQDNWNLIIKQSYSTAHSSIYLANGSGSALWVGGSSMNNGRYIAVFKRGTETYGSGGSSVLAVMDNGAVGINRENAQYNLDVMGDTRSRLFYFSDSTNNGTAGFIGRGSSDNTIHFQGQSGTLIGAGGAWLICLNSNLNVGIRNMSPAYTLDISGYTDWAFHINNTNSFCFQCNSEGNGMWLGVKGTSGYIFRALGNVDSDGSGGTDVIYAHANGNVGICTSSPSYRLHVSGTIYATGSVTALSDARKKFVVGNVMLDVEKIASAPAVNFLWKDERKSEGVQVGSIAQYWQTVLPEVVMDKGGELSMQYGVAALVSAIITARKVVDHERRISELESRLKIEN